jgi:hypothetical protein
LWFVFLLFVSV